MFTNKFYKSNLILLANKIEHRFAHKDKTIAVSYEITGRSGSGQLLAIGPYVTIVTTNVLCYLPISRIFLLHNTTHAYIGETYNERQSREAVI
jgi:hypothetical protein